MSSRKTCEAGVTSPSTKPGHKFGIPVVAHAAGSHSPQWELAQRNSYADTVEKITNCTANKQVVYIL